MVSVKKAHTLMLDNFEELEVDKVFKDIREKVVNARTKMLKQIDTTMTEVYWYVGKTTSEIYNNSSDGTYGKRIIDALSQKINKGIWQWFFFCFN